MTKEKLNEIKRNAARLIRQQYCPACGRTLPLGEFRDRDNHLNDLCNDCRKEGRRPA